MDVELAHGKKVGKGRIFDRIRAMTTKVQKYTKGLSQGKTKKQAALDAGYSKSTAENAKQKIEGTKQFENFRGELQTAFVDEGISPKSIVCVLKTLIHKKQSIFRQGREIVGEQPDAQASLKAIHLCFKILGVYDAPRPQKTFNRVDFDKIEAYPPEEIRKILMDLLRTS